MTVFFGGVALALLTVSSALAPSSVDSEVTSSCKGSKDPVVTEPLCYEGKAGALGLDETVNVKIESFASSAGSMDLTGSGITGFTCTKHSFTKSGQKISTDLSDCLPKLVDVESVEYCSDTDEIQVKVKDTKIPIPITAMLKKITCPSLEVTSSCSGSKDPVVTGPVCYEGKAGALGLDETVNVKIESFASSAGSLDLTGSGIEGFTCTKHAFTKSGQKITTDLSDCLPKLIDVESVEYCSDTDEVQVKVKDKKIPIPITAMLKKITCPSSVTDVVVV